MTKNSKIILDIINEHTCHFTSEELYMYIVKNNIQMSHATVYNSLNELYISGCIRKVVVEGKPDRYDKIIRHDHLICKSCGRVSDLMLDDLSESIIAKLNMDIESYDLRVFYICDECKTKKIN